MTEPYDWAQDPDQATTYDVNAFSGLLGRGTLAKTCGTFALMLDNDGERDAFFRIVAAAHMAGRSDGAAVAWRNIADTIQGLPTIVLRSRLHAVMTYARNRQKLGGH